MPIKVVRIAKGGDLKWTVLQVGDCRVRIPVGCSVRVDLSNQMRAGRQPAAVVSYILGGNKTDVKLWFHATKNNKAPPVPKNVTMMLAVDGGGFKPGYPKPAPQFPGLPPAFPPSSPSSFRTWMNMVNIGSISWCSRFVPIPTGATHITLRCSQQAVPESGYDLKIRSTEFAGGYMGVSLSKSSGPPHSYTQYYILQYAHTISHRSMPVMHMMMTGLIEAGYPHSGAKKMIRAALASLARQSGYELQVAEYSACARTLAKVGNPMAALRLAWLTRVSNWLERQVVKVEIPDGDLVYCAGIASPYRRLMSFRLSRFDSHHRCRRSWGGCVFFPRWHHDTKAEMKALALAAQIVASIRHVKRSSGP